MLARIRELAAHSSNLKDISADLEVVDVGERPPEQTALTIPGLMREFRKISDQLDQLREEQATTQKRLQQLEDYLRLPWYQRIRKKPPE